MAGTVDFGAGGYRYIPFKFQYSSGVAAAPGYAIERVRLRRPVPLAEGFARVEGYLASIGRPPTAFCACELRSPAQFSEAGFIAFNEHYCATLERWGIYDPKTRINPVARSNVCPKVNAPTEPMLYAFSFTVPARDTTPSFVIAGSGEAPTGGGKYGDHIVRRGETSPDAMADKARAVLGEMEHRMRFFGAGWAGVTGVQVYTIYPVHGFFESEIARRGAAEKGITWYLAQPPVVELEYEMDTRAIALERTL